MDAVRIDTLIKTCLVRNPHILADMHAVHLAQICRIGIAEFFGIIYIGFEAVSILKNMALCGLPVKRIWFKVREFLGKYTDELPDND